MTIRPGAAPVGSMVPSLIRTYVPLAVSFLVGWLLTLGIEVDDQGRTLLVSGLSSLIGAIYYAAARVLERKFAWATVLLGSSVQPTSYAPAAEPTPPPFPAGSTGGSGGSTSVTTIEVDPSNRHATGLPTPPDDPSAA